MKKIINSKPTPEKAFTVVARIDAQILILGSMPSRKSLSEKQYYAHPRNAFWPIMAELFDFDTNLSYAERLNRLRNNGIALWDVAQQCVRPGSMDQAIDLQTVVANDFLSFFTVHPYIRAIFFNGRKAEELFARLVLPDLPHKFSGIDRHLLPSTSPAHAGMSWENKLAAWRTVGEALQTRAQP